MTPANIFTANYKEGIVAATFESKYLSLIDYCIKNPYILRPRKLASKFKLTEEQVHNIGGLLNLEILGYENRNFRQEIEFLIKENPFITAEELSVKTNVGLFVCYNVARKINYRFQNAYSIRRTRFVALMIIDHQRGDIKHNSRMQILAARIRNN